MLGGVQTDETGAHPTAALGGCQRALGGPFNLASAALPPTGSSRSYTPSIPALAGKGPVLAQVQVNPGACLTVPTF